jgi:hypothetical protein
LTPTDNEAFLREVDEELRRDQITGFWKNYGKWVAIAIGLGLVLLGGFLWYQNYKVKQGGIEGEKLAATLDLLAANKDAEAKPALDALAKSDRPGYSAAARLSLADLAFQKNDYKGAAAQYKAIAADTKVARPFRDLALVRQTAVEFDAVPPTEVVTRLSGLAVPGNPWFGSAGEMVAISYLKQNKNAEAGRLFAQIANDIGVPRSIRSRAVQMAGILGVDPSAPGNGSAAK